MLKKTMLTKTKTSLQLKKGDRNMFKIAKNITLSIVITLLLFSLTAKESHAIDLKKGDKAPAFSLNDTKGNKVSLSDFKGKVVFMTFWATWCAKCWEEIDFTRKSIKRSDDLVILLVNMERKAANPEHLKKITDALEGLEVTDTVLLDFNLEAYSDYKLTSLPSTAVIDKEGIIQFAGPGFFKEFRDKINSEIEELTKKK